MLELSMDDSLEVVREAWYLAHKLGKISEAIKILEKYLKELDPEDPFDSYDIPHVLRRVANLYIYIGRTERAYKMTERALYLAINDHNLIERAGCLIQIAKIECLMGNPIVAFEYIKRASEYTRTKRGEKFLEIRIDANMILGDLYRGECEYDKAVYYYKGVSKAELKVKKFRRIDLARRNLAETRLVFKDVNSAGKIYALILRNKNRVSVIDLPNMHLLRVRTLIIMKKYLKAERLLEEIIDSAIDLKLKPILAEAYELLGDLYFKTGSSVTNTNYYLKAYELYEECSYEEKAKYARKKSRNFIRQY